MAELVFILIYAGICGAACASIAEGKGRNGQTWFFLGAIFGLIALAIIAVMPQV
jgi:hypothetical protein